MGRCPWKNRSKTDFAKVVVFNDNKGQALYDIDGLYLPTWRSNTEPMWAVGFDEILENLSVEDFLNFDVIAAATETTWSDNLITSMVKTGKFHEEVSHGAYECLKKPTTMALRRVIKT